MSVVDRFTLFTQARERLGRGFSRTLVASLPVLADAIEAAAMRENGGARRSMLAAAGLLRIEGAERARRALVQLYDIAFRLLELNQTRPAGDDPPLLALLPDQALDRQILADELAQALRERLETVYPRWLARVDALTGTDASDARAPLGAGALATAAVEAIWPPAVEHAWRPTLRTVVLEHLAPPLADVLADAERWLDEQGVAPRERPPPARADRPDDEPDAPGAMEESPVAAATD
ncbi:MAG TPA: DUF1631 family protein, partial [Burkholderiaceae bacterium]|nr:DUF1631 family protein [Burkholderiaceae bacterium]